MPQFHLPHVFGKRRRKDTGEVKNRFHYTDTDSLRKDLEIAESPIFGKIVVENEPLYRQMIDEDRQRRK